MKIRTHLHITGVAIAVMAIGGTPLAWADGPSFKFSGFGTVGATSTNSDEAQTRSNLDNEYGATTRADFGFDSRLGLQGQVEFGKDFSAMGQVMAIRRDERDLKAGVEWLFAQYSGVPKTDIRVGRLVLPAFLVSDTRYVGYSIQYARVPMVLYSMLPMSTVDGAQLVHRQTLGETVVTGQVSIGKNSTNGNEVTKIRSVNLTVEHGDWTGRVGQTNSHVRLALTAIPEFDDKFTGFGGGYDNGKYFANAEYVKRRNPQHFFDSHAYYTGGGFRIGKFAPYVIYSKFKGEDSVQPAFSVPVPFPPFSIPIILITPETETTGHTLGLRYEVAKNMALKVELSKYEGRSPILFRDPAGSQQLPAGFTGVKMATVNLDFVF